MAASVVDTSFWIKFFIDAGIPSGEATAYAIKFTDNRIQKTMLLDLNKDYLNDMGISCLGDIIAILKHAKAFHDRILRERTLEKIDGPPEAVKIAAVAAATRQSAPSSTPAAAVAAVPQRLAAARIQATAAAAATAEQPRVAAAAASATTKPSSSNATALAAVSKRPADASVLERKAPTRHSGMRSDRVSSMPASEAGAPETESDQDDEFTDSQSSAAATPRPHRAVLPPRKRPSAGSSVLPTVPAKKRLGVNGGSGESERSQPSSSVPAAVSTKPKAASASAKSRTISAGSQASIFSRLGSAGARADDAAADEPRVTVTGLGKAQLVRKPDTPSQVVRPKRPASGTDMSKNGTRKSVPPSDDAKAAARMLVATARTATASTAVSRPARLSRDPEVDLAITNEPRKHVISARTVVTGSQRAAAGTMTADSPLLRQDVKQRLGSSAGDGPSARDKSTRIPTVTVWAESAADRLGSGKRVAAIATGVLHRVGVSGSGASSSSSDVSTERRLTSSVPSDDLRKRIGVSTAAVTALAKGGDGTRRPQSRGSVFSRLGGL